MNVDAAREEICRIGRSLFERGYVHSTAGNISVRLSGRGGYLITPTDACLGFLQPGRLSHVDIDGNPLGGERASKTLDLHRRIYAADAAAHCIVHTHSTHCVALTLAGVWTVDDVLPPITPYQVMKVGHVPLVTYHRPGSPQLVQGVIEAIDRAQKRGTPIRAVLHERLGPTVWEASPARAMALLEELEETARVWLLGARSVSPLEPAQIDDLRGAFGACW
jgi:ribulose-5-phosphate 4-epimerase/fuculose-1-phosphate aldolase